MVELERAAAERLEALERSEAGRRPTADEAEQRARDVAQLTAWLQERDARITELEHAAADRLEALERTEAERLELLETASAALLQLTLTHKQLNGRFAETDRERLRLAALIKALESESFIGYCSRRLKKRRDSAAAG